MKDEKRYAIYSCLNKYSREVKQNGIIRKTSAYFWVSDLDLSTKNRKLRDTIAISVFHGITLEVWNSLSKYQGDIKKCINKEMQCTGISTFILGVHRWNEKRRYNKYIYIDQPMRDSYPYYKVGDRGIALSNMSEITEITTEITGYLHFEENIRYPRFFQKNNSKEVYINDIPSKEILDYCERKADRIIDLMYQKRR